MRGSSFGFRFAAPRLALVASAGLLWAFSGGGAVEAQTGPAAAQVPPAFSPAPVQAPISPAERAARGALQDRVAALGRAFDGEVGIAVREIDSGYVASWNGNRLMPQQSVSKFWVALTAFDAIDQGRLSLDKNVTLRRSDLTLFSQPIAQQVGANGYTTTIEDLLRRAITRSDNTANDFLLWQSGGPDAVRKLIARANLRGVRFGPGERLLQSHIAGVKWQQSFSQNRGFEAARARVPASTRRQRFEAYIEDPIDGASPLGLTDGLAKLQRGELLSPHSTRRMLAIMEQTRTGPMRLKGGLAPGWRIGHKTGTGQVFGSTQAGYNNIGIITAPDGRKYALAVMIGRTSVPNIVRMRLMQNVTRAAIEYHETRRGGARYSSN